MHINHSIILFNLFLFPSFLFVLLDSLSVKSKFILSGVSEFFPLLCYFIKVGPLNIKVMVLRRKAICRHKDICHLKVVPKDIHLNQYLQDILKWV